MDQFNHAERIIAKQSECWENLCDKANKGILENHAIKLRLAHLKNAFEKNAISYEVYCVLHERITGQYNIEHCRDYQPCTLMDFGRTLTTYYYNSIGDEEINQSLEINQCFKNINHQNNVIININDYYPDKENSQMKMPKKSRKRSKKKKKSKNTNHSYLRKTEAELIENFEDQYNNKTEKCTSTNSVKIFVRQINKQKKLKTINKESTKKSIKDVISEILKQYKKERCLQC